MTTSQGPVLSGTEAMLAAERDHSSLVESPNESDPLSNGLLLQLSDAKQNGHTNNGSGENPAVHHSNGHSTANGNVFESEVYVCNNFVMSNFAESTDI